METGAIGKLAFRYLGNSSLFRESQLWQEASPLVYSTLFPSKIPKDLDERIKTKLAKVAEESALQSEVDAEVQKILENNNEAKINLAQDPLSSSLTAIEDAAIVFDGTAIDYNVFFLE